MGIQLKYQKLFLIGNGFDLNLGLKTSYGEFIQSRQFEEIDKENNPLARFLKSRYATQNWIDVEKELLEFSVQYQKDFNREFNEIKASLFKYISNITYENISTDSSAFQLFQNEFDDNSIIIDFNYTNSIEKIFLLLNRKFDNIKLEKIHGSIKEGAIIFGVEDSAQISRNHIYLKKSYNKNFKAIRLSELLLSTQEIYIFGHSLGESDHSYFQHFFDSVSLDGYDRLKRKLKIFHYGESGYTQILTQLDKLSRSRLTSFKQNSLVTLIDSSVKE